MQRSEAAGTALTELIIKLFKITKEEQKTILGIKKKFDKFDSSGDGYINLFEMQSQSTDTKEILMMSDVMERYDKAKNDGKLNYVEFVTWMAQGRLKDMFKDLDRNKDGKMNKHELWQFVRDSHIWRDFTDQLLSGIIKEADTNNDGAIEVGEFASFLITNMEKLNIE
ncbi:uncharacterized protein LOC135485549 isoform X2 [Lineus longissimus]|uniref:uncharacterized protein LOC135485549 isoform X2 n=1 Tax=Lineus longissimus TaxID=88925 RepID=UPI002B4C3CB9